MTNYNFTQPIDLTTDKRRKWDRKIIAEKFGAVPADFIPMWIADMDFQSPPEIQAAFSKIVSQGNYGYISTYQEFYTAVIDWQKEQHNVTVREEWITLSYGTVSTLHYLYQAFCNEQQGIIVHTPAYDPFAKAAKNNQIPVVCNPLKIKNMRYEIDFELLEKQMVTEKPKLYVFCSPHNPSGRIWSAEELTRVFELCKKHQVILVADEVHSEHILHGKHHSTLSFAEEDLAHLIFLTSPNKAFNLGGLKTSYSIIPNLELRQLFRQQLQKNSVTSPNLFGIQGIVTAYTEGQEWLNQLKDYLSVNASYVVKAFKESDLPIELMELESSYLIWFNIAQLHISSSQAVQELATEVGVLLENGEGFIANGEFWLRMNIGMPFDQVKEATKRIITYFSTI